jgi:hypothetical protein
VLISAPLAPRDPDPITWNERFTVPYPKPANEYVRTLGQLTSRGGVTEVLPPFVAHALRPKRLSRYRYPGKVCYSAPDILCPLVEPCISNRLKSGRIHVKVLCTEITHPLLGQVWDRPLRVFINGIPLVRVLRHLVAAHLRLLGLSVRLSLCLHLHVLLPLWQVVEPRM